MPRSDDEKRAYSRGYNAGYNCRSYHKWPAHRPPFPPVEQVGQIMLAAQAARDAIDTLIATGVLEESEYGRFIDGIDKAMGAVTEWIRSG